MYRYPKLATRIKKPDPEPIARKLVKDWSVDKQGLGISFEDRPSIYVKDTTTPANDTDITLEKDGLDTFSSFFTYTSPSIKNVRQADGDLKYAAHNIINVASENIDSWGGLTDATTSLDATTAPDGTTTADKFIENSGTVSPQLQDSFSITLNKTYRFSVYAKAAERSAIQLNYSGIDMANFYLDTETTEVGADGGACGGFVATLENVVDGWFRCSVDLTCLSTTSGNLRIYLNPSTTAVPSYTGDGSSGIYLWGAQMNETPADTTYISKPTDSRKYAIPLQYDLGNKAEGVLIEPAATNLVLEYIIDTGTTAWSNGLLDATVKDTTEIAPDGLSTSGTVQRLQDDGLTGTIAVYAGHNFTVSTSTAYTFSFYAAADQLNWCYIQTVNFTTPGNEVSYFDLANGVVGTAGSGHTNGIEFAGTYGGNDWYRAWITFTTDVSDTSGSIRIGPADADTDNVVDRDGTSSIFVWGAQFETGSIPTSLVKTFGATATRAGDDLVQETADTPLSSVRRHTLYVKYTPRITTSASRVIAEVRGLDNNRTMSISSLGAAPRFTASNPDYSPTTVFDDNVGAAFSVGVTSKLAAVYSADDFIGSYDGNLGTPDRAGAPANSSLLLTHEIGHRNNTLHSNGLIREYAYFPQKTPPSLLQDLTGGVAETAWRGPKAQYWVDGEPDALSIDFTDDHFKVHGNSDFYGSCWVLQSSQASYREDFNGVPTDFLTYTSPSAKNIICDDGNLKYAPHNLLEDSEAWATTWTINNATRTAGQTDHLGGSTGILLTEDATAAVVHRAFASNTIQSGSSVNIRFYAKLASGTRNAYCRINAGGTTKHAYFNINSVTTASDTGVTESITLYGDGWYLCEAIVENVNSTADCVIGLCTGITLGSTTYDGDGTSGIYFSQANYGYYPRDNSYLATGGSSESYALPIEFYPSGTIKGLLVEPAATNLCSDSQDFTGAAWTPTNETLTQNATGPDGVANSAWTFAHDGVAGAGVAVALSDTVSVATSTAYTFSVYAKSGTVDFIALRTSFFTTPGDVYSYFDLSTGVVASQGSGHTGTIEDVGGGWYRCAITFTTDVSDTSGIIRIHLAQADLDSLCDSGDNALIYGAQFETGTTPTSLIKTYGATATRAVDDITQTTTNVPAGSAESYSIYYEIEGFGSSNSKQMFNVWDGTSTNRVGIYANTSFGRLFVGDSGSQADIASSNITTAGVHRIVVKAAPNDFAVTVDGASATTDSAGTVPTGMTEISIQGLTDAPYRVRRVVVLPRDLDNADLVIWSNTGELP
jgi:hypothetical protein